MANGYGKTSFPRGEGQSLVEFALILPLMVLIIAGLFDLGRAFFASITITNAAREGARYGALNPDYIAGVCTAAKTEALSTGISLPDNEIKITCGTTMTCPVLAGVGCPDGLPIIVKVGYNYHDMILKFFFPTPIYMERQVEMLIP